ncbi:glycosyltransferase [Parapedobacter lycopersici]|uniref:glycosyltransferase n=1 Tax=Parapedobacter lycopersici TaxID=1864939 RepID=UPI00333F62B0
MKQPAVEILMATYNGAAYIEEQIRSLQAQTFPHWRLLIHDDGSTDTTTDIVAGFSKQDDRIRMLSDNVNGVGAAHNFLHLLAHTDADIVMLCDQDDSWLPDKIEIMLSALMTMDGPALVYSNAYYLNNGRVIKRQVTRLHPTMLDNFLFLNSGIQGCSMMMNRALINILGRPPATVVMHDHLITLGALCFGQLRYIDKVLMLYRQHGDNVTAHHVNRWKQAKRWFFTDEGVVDRRHFDAVYAFYQHYKDQLDDSQRHVFKEYFKFVMSAGLPERLRIVRRNRFSLGGNQAILLVKTLLRKTITER